MRALTLAAVLAAGTILAGCQSNPRGAITAANNPSLYSVHQPVVERTDFVLDLDASGDTLSSAEQARLPRFGSIELRYGDSSTSRAARLSSCARAPVAGRGELWECCCAGRAPRCAATVARDDPVIASRATLRCLCPLMVTRSVPNVEHVQFRLRDQFELAAWSPPTCVCSASRAASERAAGQPRVRVYRDRQPTGTGTLQSPSTRSGGQ
jgi:pilus assembly protein CpaD